MNRQRRKPGRKAAPEPDPLHFSDEEEGSDEEQDSALAVGRGGKQQQRGRVPPRARATTSRRGRQEEEEDDEEDSEGEDDDEDEDDDDEDDHPQRGRRLSGMTDPAARYGARAGAGSYLPTAYGAPGPPDTGLGGAGGAGQSARERSVDRIRARSRDRRRDVSKDRGPRTRDRSRSQSQSRNKTENQKAAERAAERRRSRRATLEQSLGMMSMDDSGSSLGGDQSVFSNATEQSSLSMVSSISGMDSSFSHSLDAAGAAGRNRKGRGNPLSTGASSRDATSTDYTTERKRQVKPSKTWDGRLDHVLASRRGRGEGGGAGGEARSLSPSAAGKDKRSGRRPAR